MSLPFRPCSGQTPDSEKPHGSSSRDHHGHPDHTRRFQALCPSRACSRPPINPPHWRGFNWSADRSSSNLIDMAQPRSLHWSFPLPRTHTGILLGNGVQGLMIWGTHSLNLTVGRAGFWDHRGGNAFASRTTYKEIRRLLEAGDESTLQQIFANPDSSQLRPQQIGGGRIEFHFKDGYVPTHGCLRLDQGIVEIALRNPAGQESKVLVHQSRTEELTWLELPEKLLENIRCVPSWHLAHAQFSALGIEPPTQWNQPDHGGFEQSLPQDQPLALAWCHQGRFCGIATALGENAAARAKTRAAQVGPNHESLTFERCKANQTAWQNYWKITPSIDLPDPLLQELWDYGLFKQAGLTPPQGLPATLQGPWMEEYQIPPWSNDYHLNINLQMIYWPALVSGHWDHFKPLWAMMRQWFPQLQANGAAFFQNPRAWMLPHAVDDRCATVGTFWTGMIDHACTAWMAQMAWLHYRYAMDESILREIAWPLLNGAFEGYWSMFEEKEGRLHLPVSVSPEFKGARIDAWGRNASFQLAACHFLAQTLPLAAQILDEPVDERWLQVQQKCPPYTTIRAPRTREYPEILEERIALWEGMDLIESHRHHSHLGGLFPFGTLDPNDPATRRLLERTLFHWVRTGAGAWSGWSLPWAAILCARMGWADAAIAWLHWWHQVFTNEGRGTLHDAAFPGASSLYQTGSGNAPGDQVREIMQMDAGMGAVAAIAEILVQSCSDGIHVLPGLPTGWKDFSFEGIYAEGGVRLGAQVRQGKVSELRIESLVGGPIVVHHPITDLDGGVFKATLKAGEIRVLRPPSAHP